MAGFCTKCGRPLPENGVCPCTLEQPQQSAQQPQYQQSAQQPYVAPEYSTSPSRVGMVLGGSLKNIPNLFVGYFRDPVGTSRLAYEKRDQAIGWIMLAVTFLLSLFGTLLFGVIHLQDYVYREFADMALQWIFVSLLGPVVALAVTLCLFYLLAAIAKKHVDFSGAVALFGVNCILPAVLLAVSLFAGMIGPTVFEIFAILTCAAWAVAFFTSVFQVLGIKMNIVNTLVMVAGLSVAYYVITLLVTWLLYDGTFHTLVSFLNF